MRATSWFQAWRVISSLSKVHASTENDAFLGYLANPATAVITSTVTEAGYVRNDRNGLDIDNPGVIGDVEALLECIDYCLERVL